MYVYWGKLLTLHQLKFTLQQKFTKIHQFQEKFTGSPKKFTNFKKSSPGSAGILQICNIARHSVVIIYVPIYLAFY